MRLLLAFSIFTAALTSVRGSTTTNGSVLDVLIVAGAPGEPQYARIFSETVQDWVNACAKAQKSFRVLDGANGTNQLEELRRALETQQHADQELWVALIGHGTFDGTEAKFNLAGPDLSAKQAAGLVKEFKRPLIWVNASAASAPFINELSGTNRIIVTATKSGFEENFTRFGIYFAKALGDLEADVDKDGQVSVLEGFLTASRRTEEFYKNERRLATEHALLDDNGDGRGTPATFFSGVRPAKKPEEAAEVDGFRAHQIQFIPCEAEAKLSPAVRKRRNELELELERARARKASMSEDEYLKRIEPTLLELGKLYREAGAPAAAPQ